jgi:phosphoglycerate dehydrogenase-like enzyme
MDLPVVWFERRPPAGMFDHLFEIAGPEPEAMAAARATLVGGQRWDAARFDLAPRLEVLARTGIGVDAVDLPEATRRGVVVVNTPEGPTVSTAEHTIALIMAVTKTLPVHQRRLREASGDYAGRSDAIELNGLTLGLMAYGRIARRVARMARAIGMHVIAHDPYVIAPDEEVTMVSFDELLDRADVVSLHAPLLPETAYCIGADQFAAMRRGAVFVNCARGGLVDHDALLAALDAGHLFGAGLDVTDPEPLPPDHPLLHREQVVVTPHVASATVVGKQRMVDMAVEQVLMVLRGERPPNVVNPEVYG